MLRRSPRSDVADALFGVDGRLDVLEAKLDQLVTAQGGLLTALLAESRLYVRSGETFHKVTCAVAQGLVLRREERSVSCTCEVIRADHLHNSEDGIPPGQP